MSSDKYFISISDVHHGTKPVEEFEKEFYEGDNSFFSILISLIDDKDFIGVALTGDYYDSKLSMEDKKSKLASRIFLDIFTLCKTANKYFLVLRGTYSHDFRQLDHFKALESTYDRFKLVNTVEVVDFNGIKTLCIPEEYIDDSDSYYKEYFDGKYDLILGHGLFKYNCYEPNESEKPMAKMPIFDENVFIKCSPLTIFGHVHRHSSYRMMIYYNGSFSRLCFGEEDPKGFLLVTINPKRKTHNVTFIENEFAPTFVTLMLEKIVDLTEEFNFELVVKTINRHKKKYDNLKIKVAKDTIVNYPSQFELLKGYFAGKKGILIEGSLYSLKTKESIDETNINESEDVKEEDVKYNFLLENTSIYEKVAQFINVKYPDKKVEITLDDIRDALASE